MKRHHEKEAKELMKIIDNGNVKLDAGKDYDVIEQHFIEVAK